MAAVGEEIEEITSESSEINSSEEAIPIDCLECLRTSFGHSEFRPMQWTVIASILNERRDNCFFTASAYGKSLTYQFPAVYTKSIVIVVTPLISLIQDQIRELHSNGVSACYMGSCRLHVQENRPMLIDVVEGQYNIVYVTSEYITCDAGKNLLQRIGDKITLIAIDQAHCISEWGHDFRPAYCQLHQLRRFCPGVPIIALTATATPRVQEDIINGLGLHEPQIIRTTFDRPNLYFSVAPKTVVRLHGFDKIYGATMNFIVPHIRETTTGSIIVHCVTKGAIEYVAAAIQHIGFECVTDDPRFPIEKRKKGYEDFVSGRIRIICLTSFGFGIAINRLDVRLVIIYGAAISLESLYQRAGAAGRDGLPAKCLMFYNDNEQILEAQLYQNCQTYEEETIKRYVYNKEVCRRRYMLSYFGEKCDELQPRPDCCDICNTQLET